MTILNDLDFINRFAINNLSAAAWIYAVLIFFAVLIGVGLLWGKMWNRDWSLGGRPGPMVMILLLATLCAYSLITLRGISRVQPQMSELQTVLSRSLTSSGTFNRSVLRAAWSQLYPLGGQQGLTPPDQAGNEIRLNNPNEAFLLAAIAAEETRSALRNKMPFVIGAPLLTKSANAIAAEAVDAVNLDDSRYPVVVNASNEWSKAAVTLQVIHALDTSYEQLKPKLEDLKTAFSWLLVTSLLLPVIFIPLSAIKDIKINPKG